MLKCQHEINENYLRALRSSTTSTCDVIDDWWLMVDRAPAFRPPANKIEKKQHKNHIEIIEF